MQPVYLVFAGINGAGKSTFYESGEWTRFVDNSVDQIVNPDKIAQNLSDDCSLPELQLKAAKVAKRKIDSLFSEHKSFGQETTLCGKTSLSRIRRAIQNGYKVFIIYLGIDNVDIAKSRINKRVSQGGHYIDDNLVDRRNAESIRNFLNIVEEVDEAIVIDNTERFEFLAHWKDGTLDYWDDMNEAHPWLCNAMKNPPS